MLRSLVWSSLFLSSCAGLTAEDTARFLAPNRLYVEAAEGQTYTGNGGDRYTTDDPTLTFGLQWDLMPTEVRVRRDEPAWYEPASADVATITIPTSGDGSGWISEAAIAILTLGAGGGAVAYARRKKHDDET